MRERIQSMSGAGMLVVGSMCLALLMVVGAVCWLAIDGNDVPDALDRVLQGLLVGVPAMLAKTYKDTPSTEPQDVRVVSPDPLPVAPEPVEDVPVEPPSRRR
jgi:hypothetical protein